MEHKCCDIDIYFREYGLEIFSNTLNRYLGTNNPTEDQREFLAKLYKDFPQFIIKAVVYRAVRSKNIPQEMKNKFVSGCRTFEDVNAFIKKRWDKGYTHILISKDEIECFDLHAFIYAINYEYGKILNEGYQDEKEVLFKMVKKKCWYKIQPIKIN